MGEWWHVLHGELDLCELCAPAVVEVLDRVEHEVVEDLGAGAREWHVFGHQRTAQTAAVPIPPPEPPDPARPAPGPLLGHPPRL